MDEYTRKIRYSRETEGLLRQFLKTEVGLGKNEAYIRGHIFNFEFNQEQRDIVNEAMREWDLSFEEAFDAYFRAWKEG
jgi:hypothetical protein